MRTLINWKSDDDRRYSTHGTLRLKVGLDFKDSDISLIKEEILRVDRLFPWHEDVRGDLETGKSNGANFISDGSVTSDGTDSFYRYCIIEIHPKFSSMRRSQVYAYEKYLMKLASGIKKGPFSNVFEVWSIVYMCASMRSE